MGSSSATLRRMNSSRSAWAVRRSPVRMADLSTFASHCSTSCSEVSRMVCMLAALSSAVKHRLACVCATRMYRFWLMKGVSPGSLCSRRCASFSSL